MKMSPLFGENALSPGNCGGSSFCPDQVLLSKNVHSRPGCRQKSLLGKFTGGGQNAILGKLRNFLENGFRSEICTRQVSVQRPLEGNFTGKMLSRPSRRQCALKTTILRCEGLGLSHCTFSKSMAGRRSAVETGGVLQCKSEVHCSVSLSSRLRSQKGTAIRMGDVLRYKLEAYWSTV